MRFRKTLLLTAFLAAAMTAQAVPARPGLFRITQPDGTVLAVRQVGDEYLHFTLTDDGKILTYDRATGFYNYGRVDETSGKVADTGVRARNAVERTAEDEAVMTAFSDIDYYRIDAAAEKTRRLKRAANNGALQMKMPSRSGDGLVQKGLGLLAGSGKFPRTGNIRGLVILAETADVRFDSGHAGYQGKAPGDYIRSMIRDDGFSLNGSSGSATEYLIRNSNGLFNPDFDVIGPVMLPGKMSFYGRGEYDENAGQMIVDACKAADPYVNFKDYDNDGDGKVDFVFVIYAGESENPGNIDAIWPHASDVSGWNVELDGVNMDRYACGNEIESGQPNGAGTFLHEFSHVMGLPDLYVVGADYHTNTPMLWSVMDVGCYNNNSRTPPVYSSFERLALGWIDPEILTPGEAANLVLDPMDETGQACIALTDDDYEYFLFENRQQQGWDTYLPGHGMIAWHIRYRRSDFNNNQVNNNRQLPGVDLIEATGTPTDNAVEMAKYSFPGTGNVTALGHNTSLSRLRPDNGASLNLEFTDITENPVGQVTARINGGEDLPVPAIDAATAVTADSFVANWQKADGADNYRIVVYAVAEGGSPEDETIEFGAVRESRAPGNNEAYADMPRGWSGVSDSNGDAIVSTSEANRGFKMKTEGAWLASREYDAPVNSISFSYWNSNSVGNTVEIQSRSYAGWTTFDSFAIESRNGSGKHTVKNIPAGMKEFRIVYHRGQSGFITVNGIRVKTGVEGQADTALDDFYWTLTGDVTSAKVDRLLPGVNRYKYAVAAVYGCHTSAFSRFEYVTTGSSGVDNITATDRDTLSFEAEGGQLRVYTDAPRVEVFDISGRMVALMMTVDGQAVTGLPRGVYLIRAGLATAKVSVR